jgi:sulfhydrogenase subunit delta
MAKSPGRALKNPRVTNARLSKRDKRPRLAVWKFASCDGCQLSLLDCEKELLEVAELLNIANFMEASRSILPGPYDISLVEGSITTPHDAERIQNIRHQSKVLVTIGACATAGGIQALRNYASIEDYTRYVYAHPEYIRTLSTSTPIAKHIKVDFELQGCPISKKQFLEVISAFLSGRKPNVSSYSECMDCKILGHTCVMVAHGTPCLGPITHAGCGVLCPSYNRGCYGCFGPKETPNAKSLGEWFLKKMGKKQDSVKRSMRSFYSGTDTMRKASEEFNE